MVGWLGDGSQFGGETHRLTRFPNIGHTPCVMNRPPTTINVLASKAFAVT
ncbi:MAG: hypothetical protein IPG23_13095 [Burkholderiales bacterium]|nr:hypothetical protein [Burkholderiales bacterium]